MTTTSTQDWIDTQAEVIHETAKAVLLDFGADRGCSHQAWVPKSHYRTETRGAFECPQISRRWVNMKGLWKWLSR